MRARADLPVTPKPDREIPHLFGFGLRERVLMTLAVNDRPVYVTELAGLLHSDASKIRQTLVPLEHVGIVASRFTRNNLRWVALNSTWPAHVQALRYLRRLEAAWPQPRVGKPRRRAERVALAPLRPAPGRPASLPSSDRLGAEQLDMLFGSRVRTRTLLGIAAMGHTEVVDLASTMTLDGRSVWNAANHWQREGVVRSRVDGRRRVLELDPAYPLARELRLLLARLVVVTEEYTALARLSTRRPGSPRFVTAR